MKLPPKCIFCDKVTIKIDYKKETLTNCEEKVGDRSTAQKTIHRAAVLQQDHKIIKLFENYNFLAAEAKYHRTCYKEFTRSPKPLSPNSKELTVDEEKYLNAEDDAFKRSFKYICTEIIAKAELTTLMQLTRVATGSIKQTWLEINTSAKKNLRRKIEMQFSTSLEMLQKDKRKVVVVPNTVSKEKLAIKVVKLQETVKNLT